MANDNRYPNQPGYRANAPEASKQGADYIAPVAATIRAKVLGVVTDAGPRGATGHEVATALDMEPHQVRSRLSELKAADCVVNSGQRRKCDASPVSGTVWVLPEFGPAKPADPQGDLPLAEAA